MPNPETGPTDKELKERKEWKAFSNEYLELSDHRPLRSNQITRFKNTLCIYGELLNDEGGKIETVVPTLDNLSGVFSSATPERQRAMLADLTRTVDSKLKSRFGKELNLLHDIRRENGVSGPAVGEDERAWENLFNNSSKNNRLLLVRLIRTETEHELVVHFEYYVSAWKDLLPEMGRTQGEINNEINDLKEKFDKASDKGKVGIAKTLREKTLAVSEVQSATAIKSAFDAYLEMYRAQTSLKVLCGIDYPNADELQQLFNDADSANKRKNLLTKLESLTMRALNSQSQNFPNA
jgi:hypothetical protein